MSAYGSRAARFVAVAIAVSCILAAIPGAMAHRQKMGLTEISVNPRTGTLEVAHQFNIHDAEHAVQRMFSTSAGILSDVNVRRAFARYVASEFRVIGPSGDLDLALLGTEIEGSRLWIYQEAQLEEPVETLEVEMTAMHTVWPGHVNLVNVRTNASTQSLLFEAGSTAQFIALQ